MTVTATCSGTLDDANGNCIPGENVSLVFADGTQTLEELLPDRGGVRKPVRFGRSG